METVSLQIRIGDNGSFKKVEVKAEDLKEAIRAITQEAEAVKSSLVNWAETARSFDLLGSALSSLQSGMQSLVGEYEGNEVAAARLAQAMRNTMGASEEEIASIQRLCDEQQRSGVIASGVQQAAAQELATYLELSSSLETIIPVMNDMAAQQYGLGASAESITQIATMLGKVMNGQTEALSRYGYKFDEAQKKILTAGTEMERAAVLAEVVEQSVAGMNEALAQTSSGRIKQLQNNLNDVKSMLGSMLSRIMPVVSGFAQFSIAVSGVGRLTSTLKALADTTKVASAKTAILTINEKVQAVAARLLGASSRSAAVGVTALRVATVALYAAMSFGLALVIQAVIELVTRLMNRSQEAAEAMDSMAEAAEAYKSASSDMRATLATEEAALEALIKSMGQEGKKVAELNEKYGEALGYHRSAAEWYDTLKAKSSAYCRQLGYEAQAKELASQKAEKELELEDLRRKKREMEEAGTATRSGLGLRRDANGDVFGWGMGDIDTKAYRQLLEQIRQGEQEVSRLGAAFDDCFKKGNEAAAALSSGTTKAMDYTTMSLADLTREIQEQENRLKALAGTEDKTAAAGAAAVLKAMKARKTMLENTYGLGTNKTDTHEFDGTHLIENASSYKELANNIKYYQEALERANPADTESIRTLSERIAALQRAQQAVKEYTEAAGLPTGTDTLEDITKQLSYYEDKRNRASAEDIAGIDAEIARLEALRDSFGRVNTAVGEIKTYNQLDDEISYYTSLLQAATQEERTGIQARIRALAELRDSWDLLLRAPGDNARLDSLQDIDDALSYYEDLQKTQSVSEAAATKTTIAALTRKKQALEDILSLSGNTAELEGLGGLTGGELRMQLRLIGEDALEDKIRDLRALLNDTPEMSVTDPGTIAQIESQIEAYTRYRNIVRKSNLSLSQAWGNVKGIDNSITSMTDALTGNGTAWERICSLVDGFISLFESLSSVIDIIKTITSVTKAQTAATQAEGATETAVAAQTEAAGVQTVASNTAVAASEHAKATAAVTAAAGETFSAHAAIPFVGIAIAAGLVATLLAIMASLPKFASGGIAYGPTLGLFGEYSGASSNPEVVAPLSRLRDILFGADGGKAQKVRLRVKGRDLEGVLQMRQALVGRS